MKYYALFVVVVVVVVVVITVTVASSSPSSSPTTSPSSSPTTSSPSSLVLRDSRVATPWPSGDLDRCNCPFNKPEQCARQAWAGSLTSPKYNLISVYLQGARDSVGGKCKCHVGYEWKADDSYLQGGYCTKDGTASAIEYDTDWKYNPSQTVYGMNGKLGDVCRHDGDCTKVQINSNGTVKYLGDLRCNSGKCVNA